MSGNLNVSLVGLACLICFLPLSFTVAGTTTGIAGAASARLGRHDLAGLIEDIKTRL